MARYAYVTARRVPLGEDQFLEPNTFVPKEFNETGLRAELGLGRVREVLVLSDDEIEQLDALCETREGIEFTFPQARPRLQDDDDKDGAPREIGETTTREQDGDSVADAVLLS